VMRQRIRTWLFVRFEDWPYSWLWDRAACRFLGHRPILYYSRIPQCAYCRVSLPEVK